MWPCAGNTILLYVFYISILVVFKNIYVFELFSAQNVLIFFYFFIIDLNFSVYHFSKISKTIWSVAVLRHFDCDSREITERL